MELTKYLCEFFFTNFWHFCGLVIILSIICTFLCGAAIKIRNNG